MKEGYPFKSGPHEIAKVMGDGRLSVAEKAKYIEEHAHDFFRSIDFVHAETYKKVFEAIDLNGKTIVDMGAGFAFAGPVDDLNPSVVAFNELDPNCTLIPVDWNHTRTKSWLLFETSAIEKNNNVAIEPVTADARNLPFADGSIDFFISANLLNEPSKNEPQDVFVRTVLKEAYRVLTPQGNILVSSFGYRYEKSGEGEVSFNDKIKAHEVMHHDAVISILEDIGFSHIEVLPLDEELIHEAIDEIHEMRKEEGLSEIGIVYPYGLVARKVENM